MPRILAYQLVWVNKRRRLQGFLSPIICVFLTLYYDRLVDAGTSGEFSEKFVFDITQETLDHEV
jgi:hypothetical protein